MRRWTVKASQTTLIVLLIVGLLAGGAFAKLLLDDPLQGSTSGTRNGGAFVSGGWQVTGDDDWIFWHLPHSVSKGAAEFYVTGVGPAYSHKTEHFHMYDYTWHDSDYGYSPGYRENPYKMFIRKSGAADAPKTDSCEILFCDSSSKPDNCFEPDTSVLSWSAAANYRFRVEWETEGANSTLRVYRDGAQILSQTIPGSYAPKGHSIRIGKCRGMGEGAEIGAKYSNVKVWDMTDDLPDPPVVTTPSSGETLKSKLVFVKWTGSGYDRYRVRVCTKDDPEVGTVWDSGEVISAREWAWTGTLSNLTDYYVFVKLGSANGWSAWSAAGRKFRVDTSFAASNNVSVCGYSLKDGRGPFLGLGFTYMRSLQRCKYDRDRWLSDLAAMVGKGFNYQRILSMVSWRDMEIAPIAFNETPAWPDYWQQFRDMIDIAYDRYGVRTEITIFADAQICMPNNADRYAHMDKVLAELVGREHKVVQIEVCNEAFQNGFPDVASVRVLGQYLADRTSIPISNSSWDTSDAGLIDMNADSGADIATAHLSRDLGPPDGNWGPVIDCWRIANLYPRVPPVSSNEPIGPGSSVAEENDPIKLSSAATFAWIANLPMYVYHCKAGIQGADRYTGAPLRFEDSSGFGAYQHLRHILPPDLASWIRNDGIESAAPFTVYCDGQANKYWTEVAGQPKEGCHRNVGARKGNEFVCYPQGILIGGLTLQAREQVTVRVYNPLTGEIVIDTTTKSAGDQITLAQGPGAYIIRGAYGAGLSGSKTLQVRKAGAIKIDGATSDWKFSEFTTLIKGGQSGTGDIALVGWDKGALYYGSRDSKAALPTDGADHTAKVYSRQDADRLYFLVRCDDDDVQYSNPAKSNRRNDCVEFYIDPGGDGGSSPISDSESDVQLVIDANNRKWVYGCADAYGKQVLSGVTSAVVRDKTGWWLEVGIQKSALDPDLPLDGVFGMDFGFRDNDKNNDPAETTVYTWNDTSGIGFPGGIPDDWGVASIPDVTPPPGATGLKATGGNRSVTLSWTNPSASDFTGTMIRRKSGGYPTGPDDGTPVIDKPNLSGSGDSYTDLSLANETTYYYSAYAHDEVPNYAPGVNATATTGNAVTVSSSSFDSTEDGWAITVWKSGGFSPGVMGWDGSAGNPGGAMRCVGVGDTDGSQRGTREGGEMSRVISTVGYRSIQVFYDLRVSSLGGVITVAGSGSEPVDHNIVDEQLTASYSTDGGSTWTEADWLKRSDLTGAYQIYGTRIIDLSNVAACNGNPKFALKFRWQVNTSADIADLDNVIVTGMPIGGAAP